MVVSAVQCRDYSEDTVKLAVKASIDLLGGITQYLRPGQLVAVKPNLVMKKAPDEAVTTHPAVVKAVVELVQDAGGRVVICDSPGGPFYSEKGLSDLYRVSGLNNVAEDTGCQLNFDTSEVNLSLKGGMVVKRLPIITPLAEADVIINLPKLKTHSMTMYSGAVKNLYGAIPGMKKAEFHFKMSEPEVFSKLLVDVYTLVKPTLNIMDAIVGMEGDGPTAGSPKHVGLILASTNAFELDKLCVQMMGLKENEVWTLVHANSLGLISKEIILKGMEKLPTIEFKLPKTRGINFADIFLPPGMAKVFTEFLKPKIYFSPETCIGCGECVACCPANALDIKDNLPSLTSEKCIRCFCCQELCPKKAVQVKRSWLANQLFGK